jgi:tetratricopeptide (TPR) repeat protein
VAQSSANEALFAEAIRLRDLERHDEAIEILCKLLEQDPDCAPALAILGHIHRELTRYKDAVSVFERARVLKPRNSLISAGLFYSYLNAGRTDDAIAEARRYVALLDSPHPPKIRDDLPNLEETYRAWATGDDEELAALRASYRSPLRLVPRNNGSTPEQE